LYRETYKVASVVANKELQNTPEWKQANKRFFELYYADLVFIGESYELENAMVNFKETLDSVKTGYYQWDKLNVPLLELSGVLAKETKQLVNEY